MQFTYLATAVLMVCGANADAPPAAPGTPAVAPPVTPPTTVGAPPPPPAKEPTIIKAQCIQSYLPFSEADLAAMSSNQTDAAPKGNYSTVPTEVACKGPVGTVDALCDISSCDNKFPVCNSCAELTLQGENNVTTSTNIIPQVTCINNYMFGDDNDPKKNICTDVNYKTYTCTGGCTGFTSCSMCVSVKDPALQTNQTTTP
ncbi:hypothetical protein PCASD_04131 [Puccinia coronata f. sp. avenae]|uniref:Secreted protein n=1 Tax=Puccinia coronata f. sp. avenae TaxID=200324 RepID=A0A2N5VCE8_9BASI|nr:hypothetical protein PCASD_04131 [Puccinia coronata f. sp. avenae]